MTDRTRIQLPVATNETQGETSWFFSLLKVLFGVLTAPYRRTFKLYTWRPLKAIREAEADSKRLISLAKDFKADKYAELHSVQVAASFCAGATLATLSWTLKDESLWAARALWFSSLSCSIWAVITSIQTSSILDDLPNNDELDATLSESEAQRMRRMILRYRKTPGPSHWIMLFMWQFPSMTMSYAWTTFIAGLTVYICTPLIRHDPWGEKCKIAIVYLAVGSLGFVAYVMSSIFVYAGEKDFDRSAASSRANTDQVESAMNPTIDSQTQTRRRDLSSSSAEEPVPVQTAPPKGLGNWGVARFPRAEVERSGRTKRQLLI